MSDKFFNDYCREIRNDLRLSREKAAELMGDKPDCFRLEKIENNKVHSIEPLEVVNMAIACKLVGILAMKAMYNSLQRPHLLSIIKKHCMHTQSMTIPYTLIRMVH